jgi:hypothetical protein
MYGTRVAQKQNPVYTIFSLSKLKTKTHLPLSHHE